MSWMQLQKVKGPGWNEDSCSAEVSADLVLSETVGIELSQKYENNG